MSIKNRIVVGFSIFALTITLSFAPFLGLRAYAVDASTFTFQPGAIDPGGSPGAGDSQRSVIEAWNGGGGDQYNKPGWKLMAVLIKDFAGLGPQAMSYNESISKSVACTGGVYPGQDDTCSARQPYFTLDYYCTIPTAKLSIEKPSGDYYQIKYAVALAGGNRNSDKGEDFVKRNGYDAYAGPVEVRKFAGSDNGTITRKLTDSSHGPNDLDSPFPRLANGGGNINNRNDDNFGIDAINGARPCVPSPSIVGEFNSATEMKNFNKLTEEQKKLFEPAVAAAKAAASKSTDDETNCEGSGGFSLSWILCPLITIGYQTTDFVMNSLVRPLLEDIPINSDPNDGIYKAWKSFRIIGNVLLVAGMLAVVYAQARSDK